MKKSILSIAVYLSLLISTATQAELIPRGLTSDHRVKIVTFDPNNVVLLKSHYGYQTEVLFAENEVIQNISIGDSLAWQAVPVNNHLFIKPMASSRTNMTVLTNRNSYTFQLDSRESHATPTYKLQFKYSEGGYNAAGNPNAVANLNPTLLNWDYSFTGDRALAPREAFDNGNFTYFKFKQDGFQKLPAFFIVDKKRQETLVNYHIQGDYIVIQSVAKQFTLRNGVNVTTVYNDAVIHASQNIH